jgi:aspartate/methionine/tyrosine aminotransferase
VEQADQLAISESSRKVGAILIVDECYIDLFGTEAPAGILSLSENRLLDPANLIVLHTLSKRSGAPGLRSGFAIGGPDVVADYASYNRNCGVSSPLPVCAAATALWADESHVRLMRKTIAQNWDLADTHLAGIPNYRRAPTGFFLWLAVADDEAVACRLWSDHGLMTMPGRYLGAHDKEGINPGINWLRVALIQKPERMAASLCRLRTALKQDGILPASSLALNQEGRSNNAATSIV